MSETVFLAALGLICGTVALLVLARFGLRLLESRNPRRAPVSIDGLKEYLERIEMAVESTAIEVERISENNRFLTKLLSERGSVAGLPNRPPERVITPH